MPKLRPEDDIYYPHKFINYVTRFQGYDLKTVIKKWMQFEQKQMDGAEMHCYERTFIYVFDDLIYNYRARKNNKRITEQENKAKTEQEFKNMKNGLELGFEPIFTDVPNFNELKKINNFENIA